ncbi:hypothetical protein PVAND_009021 [Polypedilum vanderplanki]|uniref:DOMON domain-containing protein n=1 Tax=Polypedilum vanderplanki TaxID=319348 RepID=A0A9J6CC69_POLVA|nr:hypothetical protein PVAND_009021 [Polypedilum vanderplanki]
MKQKIILCILVVIVNFTVNVLSATTTAKTTQFEIPTFQYSEVHHKNWTRNEKLDPNGILNLQWYIRNNEIVFHVTLNSRGFVAIGFPYPNTQIKGFDVVFAWVNDKTGKANILDCHGINSRFEEKYIVKDDTQNYILENEGYQNLTHTILTFRRTLETCDPRDVPFSADTMKIYWAYGEQDVHTTQVNQVKFKTKGARSIYLLNPTFGKEQEESVSYWDVQMKDIKINEHYGSFYWCKIFKAPDHKKQHIIGFEPILSREKENKRTFVHHMTLFECKSTEAFNDLDMWSKSNGVECSSNQYSSRNWDSCVTPVAAYAYGGGAQYLPEHVGIPFSETFYMLEIHYVNPNRKTFLDHSGFRIHYTSNLRPYDAGVMTAGVTVSDTQLVPPRQKSFRNIGICGPSCTEKVFPDNGINIVSVSIHTHTSGKNVKLSHIRDGKEMNRIVEDNYYSHSYQEVRQLANETKVLPGDYLILECAYNTQNTNKVTLAGYSLNEEICLSFITYYPKTDLVGCYSMVPVKEFFEYFNVHSFHGLSMMDVENIIIYGLDTVQLNRSLFASTDTSLTNEIKNSIDEEQEYYQRSILTQLIISDPVEFHDRTFMTHLKQLPWEDQSFAKQFENVMSTGSYMLFCRVSNRSISVPQEIIKYPNFTELNEATRATCPYYIYQELLTSASSGQIIMKNLFYLLSLFLHLLHRRNII